MPSEFGKRLKDGLGTAWGKVSERLAETKLPPLGTIAAPLLLTLGLLMMGVFFVILHYLTPSPPGQQSTYSEIKNLGLENRVVSATLYQEDGLVVIQDAAGRTLYASYPKSDALTADLVDALSNPVPISSTSSKASGSASSASKSSNAPEELAAPPPAVTIDPQTSKSVLRFVDQFLIPLMILACFFSLFFLMITGKASGAGDFLGFSKLRARIGKGKGKGKGELTFNDVAAVPEAIVELQEVVDYLTAPGRFVEMGARAPKGILLAGPPGTGKTLLARAVAGEAGVPFISLSGSEFVESLVGVGAARVRDLFRQARASAPCIIFIDEIDAAGRQRGVGMGQGNDEREQTLNQLMVEMDGFNPSLGIAVMAATNRPDILDAALLRPGRFDRQVVIDVPDVKGRTEILHVHTRSRRLEPEVDLERIAKETPGFTGAELANVVNEAALIAVRRSHTVLSHEDFEEAVDRVIAGPARKSHILTEQEKTLIAYHEAGHAVVARGVGMRTGVLKLSIVARGRQLGHASTYQTSDRMVLLRSDLERQLATMLGGLAAEQLVYGEVSTGNANDLHEATELAKKIVGTYGMTTQLSRMQIVKEGASYLGRDFTTMSMTSADTLQMMDHEIRTTLDEAEKRSASICMKNRGIMEEIVRQLLERETLNGPELEPLLTHIKPLAELVEAVGMDTEA